MVFLAGFNVPCVFQIRVDGIPPPAQNALLYETVTVVEGKPILRDMVFSPDHQYIYLLSDKQVKYTLTNSQNWTFALLRLKSETLQWKS